MPYGFIRHIENKGYRPETITSYEKVIKQFFQYLRSVYPANKEPFQISPSDIKNYLQEQLEKDKSISTVNKELAILKTFFNYLWEIDKVPVDPAVKLKRYKVTEKPNLDITYEQIIEVLHKVLNRADYSPLRKAIFLMAAKGLKTADFRFKKDDVMDRPGENKLEVRLKNRTIVLEGKEAEVFREYFREALQNESEYVFVTKRHGDDVGGPVQVMSILHHLRAISDDYFTENTQALTLISIRRALAYHLFQKRYSMQMIAKELGIEASTAANYLKHLTEKVVLEKNGS
jgi:site-specific recombinase XerD